MAMNPSFPPTPRQNARNPLENVATSTPANSQKKSRYEELNEKRQRGRERKRTTHNFSPFFKPSTSIQNAQNSPENTMPPPPS
ncbi:hypothetical protein PM082_024861 [Marasmius tenuissimus]|nr:hypothetical protein PM082_024861 [Marasmius tenuissimus]